MRTRKSTNAKRTELTLKARAVLLLVAAWVCTASSTLAQEPNHAGEQTSSLNWVRMPGAESCITSQQLAALAERRLRRRVFVTPAEADMALEGRIAVRGENRASRFTATVTAVSRDGSVLGTRELGSPTADCRSIDTSLSFVVALLIDPDAVWNPEVDPEEPEALVPPTPIPVVPEPVAAPPVPPPAPAASTPVIAEEPSTPVRFGARIGALGAYSPLPSIAPGLSLATFVGPQNGFSFELGASYFPHAQLTSSDGVGTVLNAWTVDVGGCTPGFALMGGALSGCLKTGLGALGSAPFGVLGAPKITMDFYADLDAAARLTWLPTRAFLIQLDFALRVALTNNRFVYRVDGVQRELFKVSPVGGQLTLWLGVWFDS